MARGPHIMIVEARFYADIADELIKGAITVLDKEGATYDRFTVPGAFELPGAIRIAVEGGGRADGDAPRYDGYLALGCVIRGETTHYETICAESARGLMDLTVQKGIALANGILTVEDRDQAWARASVGDKNKGGEFAETCLRMIELRRMFGLGQ